MKQERPYHLMKLPTCWNCKRHYGIMCAKKDEEIPEPPTCDDFEFDWRYE